MNYLYYLTWDHPRRGTTGAYTGRFVETRWSPEAVILSAAKDLSPGQAQILRCAQDDTSHLAGSFPQKPTRVRPRRARFIAAIPDVSASDKPTIYPDHLVKTHYGEKTG